MKGKTRQPAWLALITMGAGLLTNLELVRASDDFGSWHALSVKILGTERWTLAGLGQLRLRANSSETYGYLISPQATYKASPYLRFGMNYTFHYEKPVDGDDFRDVHRWETEVNPRWPVNDWLTLDLRNRFEVRWIEGQRVTNERSRHRPQATIKLKGLGPLESVYFNNEFFYDYDADKSNQNRLVPLGLNFRINSHAVFTAYHMYLSVLSKGNWIHSNMLGTQLSLSF